MNVTLNGHTHDQFLKACVRTVCLTSPTYDIELLVCHCSGVLLQGTDAFSRMHKDLMDRLKLQELGCLDDRFEVCVSDDYFRITE